MGNRGTPYLEIIFPLNMITCRGSSISDVFSPNTPSQQSFNADSVRSDYEAAKEQLERRRSSAEAQQSHALKPWDAEIMTPMAQ